MSLPPIKTFKQEINKSWSKFKILMLKQYSFRNGIHEKLPPFKRESSWTPPPSDKHILISFFTRVEQELGSISTARWKTYNNLTLKEKTALNDLKDNRSIIIKRCGNCGAICIMNRRSNLTNIPTHLQEPNTYKLLTHNTKNATAHDARTYIHYMHSQHIIDTATMEILLPPWNTHTPLFYGLSKNTQAKLSSPPYCFRM